MVHSKNLSAVRELWKVRWLRSLIGVAAVCWLAIILYGSCSVISVWRRANHELKEMTLQNRLDHFRTDLKRYARDKGDLPQSLSEFREAGYASPLPDPITGYDDWQPQIGEDPSLIRGKKGVIN